MHSGGAPAIPYASSPNPPALLSGFASAKLATRSLRLPDQVNPSALHLLSLGAQRRGGGWSPSGQGPSPAAEAKAEAPLLPAVAV